MSYIKASCTEWEYERNQVKLNEVFIAIHTIVIWFVSFPFPFLCPRPLIHRTNRPNNGVKKIKGKKLYVCYTNKNRFIMCIVIQIDFCLFSRIISFFVFYHGFNFNEFLGHTFSLLQLEPHAVIYITTPGQNPIAFSATIHVVLPLIQTLLYYEKI